MIPLSIMMVAYPEHEHEAVTPKGSARGVRQGLLVIESLAKLQGHLEWNPMIFSKSENKSADASVLLVRSIDV